MSSAVATGLFGRCNASKLSHSDGKSAKFKMFKHAHTPPPPPTHTHTYSLNYTLSFKHKMYTGTHMTMIPFVKNSLFSDMY